MIIVDTFDSFYEMYADLVSAPILYVDTECTGLDPYTSRFLLLQIYTGKHNYVIDFLKLDLSYLKQLQFIFEDKSKVKVFHNAVFDWKMIYHNSGIDTNNMHCTMVTDQILGAGIISGYSLADVSKRRLGIDVDKSVRSQFIDRDLTATFTKEELAYAALDVELLQAIYAQQRVEIQQKQLQRTYDLECRLLPVTASMEYTGLLVDAARLELAKPLVESLIHHATVGLQDAFIEHGAAEQIVFSRDGYLAIKLSSHLQLLNAFHKAGINVESTAGGVLSEWDAGWAQANSVVTDAVVGSDYREGDDDDVSMFSHPLLKKHDIRSTASKLKGTFFDGIAKGINPVTHRLHPGFNQCGAGATGRYSSSGPNFQTMVKPSKIDAIGLDSRCHVRPLFIASPGYSYIIADYSGIELAVLAVMSGDTRLIEQVLRGDVHSLVANTLEGERIEKITGSLITSKNKKEGAWAVFRDSFKKVNYSIAYGTSEFGMHKKQYMQLASVGCPITVKDTKRWLDVWKHELFPNTGEFLNSNARHAITRGYTESVLGRRRFWNADARCNKSMAHSAMRQGMNAPIQSSSADITKMAMSLLHERLDRKHARLVATVHDEIIIEVLTEYAVGYKEIARSIMIEAGYILFPDAPRGLIEVEAFVSNCYNK